MPVPLSLLPVHWLFLISCGWLIIVSLLISSVCDCVGYLLGDVGWLVMVRGVSSTSRC